MQNTLSAEPHEDGERSNKSKSVVLEHPVVLEVVSVREQSKFGREGVRVFHLASTHFNCLVKSRYTVIEFNDSMA